MPCNYATIESDVVSATAQTTLGEALELFNKHKIRGVPVIDENNNLIGLFTLQQLLVTILPLPEVKNMHPMDISLDHLFGQAEWLSERLQKHLSRTLDELMIRDPKTVHPNTPIGEGVRLLAHYGSPVAVTEEGSKQFVGLISSQSVVKLLLNIK